MRKSDGGGGGDINFDNPKFAGRWAGDEVYLIGDYDTSNLYEKAQSKYLNIAKDFIKEYNEFVQIEDARLKIDTV